MTPQDPARYDHELDAAHERFADEHGSDPGDYDEPRPTAKQLSYLRALAERAGQTFAYPRTASQASREIRRLKGARASTRLERRLERREIADAIASGPERGAAIREDDTTTGYGSSAAWR